MVRRMPLATSSPFPVYTCGSDGVCSKSCSIVSFPLNSVAIRYYHTPLGECKIISEASNPEEFWALRGAGWGLGVITRFLIRLHPIESFDGKHLCL